MKIKLAGGFSALLQQMRRSRNDQVLTHASVAMRGLATVYVANRGADGWGEQGLFIS